MSQISPIERLPDSRVSGTVIFEKEEVLAAEKKALEHLAEHVKVAGFRPGKVPADMVREQTNPADLLEETVRHLLPGAVESMVKEHGIKPITAPKVELQNKDPLTVLITFVEYPEVTIKNPDKIAVPKNSPKADEKDVDTMVRYVLDQHKKTAPTDEPAREGHQVTMHFTGKNDKGEEIPDIRTENYKVTIGSKTLIPGFEENLTGLKAGDKKSFTLTFPENYHAETLRKQPVTFDVEVTGIEEVTLPTLTDEFAKAHLQVDSADAFKTRVKESMIQQERAIENRTREQKLFEMIRVATKVGIAPELLDDEKQQLANDLGQQLQEQKLSLEEYLTRSKMTREEFMKDLEMRAEKRLQLRFGIRKLIEIKDIQISDDEMETGVRQILSQIPEDEKARIAPRYEKGAENYEQMMWQKKVEKLIETMLA